MRKFTVRALGLTGGLLVAGSNLFLPGDVWGAGGTRPGDGGTVNGVDPEKVNNVLENFMIEVTRAGSIAAALQDEGVGKYLCGDPAASPPRPPSEDARYVFKELVRLALRPDESVTVTCPSGWHEDYHGEIGMAATSGAASALTPLGPDLQECLTGALVSLLNPKYEVPVWLKSETCPGLNAVDAASEHTYSSSDITVWGNFFGYSPIAFICVEDSLALECGDANLSSLIYYRVFAQKGSQLPDQYYVVGRCSGELADKTPICEGTPGHRTKCRVPGQPDKVWSHPVSTNLPRTSEQTIYAGSECMLSNHDAYSPCADGTFEDDFTSVQFSGWWGYSVNHVYGCADKRSYADRASACGPGYRPAHLNGDWWRYLQYVSSTQTGYGPPVPGPTNHYWGTHGVSETDYAFGLSGDPNACYATYAAPACSAGPVRVCADPRPEDPENKDTLGNTCTLAGCSYAGWEAHYGINACGDDDGAHDTAGTLCVPIECSVDADCGLGAGLYCDTQTSTCKPGCFWDGYCPSGMTCAGNDFTYSSGVGTCVNKTACEDDGNCGVGVGMVCNAEHQCDSVSNAGCHEDANCLPGYSCYKSSPETDATGFCINFCRVHPDASDPRSQCPRGFSCSSPVWGDYGWCQEGVNSECRPGHVFDGTACVPGCDTDANCDSEDICDPSWAWNNDGHGKCVSRACGGQHDCPLGHQCEKGICVTSCGDSEGCPANTVCRDYGYAADGSYRRTCQRTSCAADNDCEAGEACSDKGLCFLPPVCETSDACPDGTVCRVHGFTSSGSPRLACVRTPCDGMTPCDSGEACDTERGICILQP
jgi:hypothetical protein